MISQRMCKDSGQTIDIGSPRNSAELRAFATILEHALYYPSIDESNWADVEGVNNYRLARLNGQIVGGLAIQRMGQWFGGRCVPMAGIRCVSVSPAYRSRGIAEELLLSSLKELYTEGVPLSTLYPSSQKLYHRVGFERAGSLFVYRFPARGFDCIGRPLSIRKVEVDNKSTFADAYTKSAKNFSGRLDRNDWVWGRILQRHHNTAAYIFENDKAVEGYVVYSTGRPEGAVRGELLVHDIVALTAAAVHHIATFFSDHKSMVEWIQWHGGPTEPLFHFVVRQEYNIVRNSHWMMRIVDVEKALALRGYPANFIAEAHFKVTDKTLPWNNRKFVLEVDGGGTRVRHGGQGNIHIDVRGLAALFTGYMTPSELKLLGLIDGDVNHLAVAESLFSGCSPWMSEAF